MAALLCLGACSDDAATPISLGPTGNPDMFISSPTPRPGAELVCTSIGDDVDARVSLRVDIRELVLRPPGACGTFLQCGHLALSVGAPDPDTGETRVVLNNESSVPAVPLLMRKLANRYHDEEPLTVRIDVVNDEGEIHVKRKVDKDGKVVVGKDGKPELEPLTDEIRLCTARNCNELPTCGDGNVDPCEVCDFADNPCCLPNCQGYQEAGFVCPKLDPANECEVGGGACAPVEGSTIGEMRCPAVYEDDDTPCTDDVVTSGVCCNDDMMVATCTDVPMCATSD